MSRTAAVLILLAAFVLGGIAIAASPPPTPTAVPPAPATIQSPGQAMIEQEEAALSGRAYTYDPAGRRDPFRSLLVREDRTPGARPPGVAGMSIDEIVIHGIWKTRNGYVAQVRATDNKSYLVRAGDLLYDGEVTRVGPNEVVFRQNINDPQSVKPFREVTKQLHVTSSP